MKKILLLADVNSSHTRKWAEGLAANGFEIGVFSFRPCQGDWLKRNPGILFFTGPGIGNSTFHEGAVKKAAYLKMLPALKRSIKGFAPDILHAHYASSYGLLGRLSRFHPYIISCWGSDVMDFPNRGLVQRVLLKGNLEKADRVLATSPTIEEYIHKVVQRDVLITPFGINLQKFFPQETAHPFEKGSLVIGTIKSLEKVYCIDVLIAAFAEVLKHLPHSRLLLVGEGTERQPLEQQCLDLGISDKVLFKGSVEHEEIPRYHNMIDIFVNVSAYESFGVSVLEAMACGKAVIVTNTGGLAEIIENESEGAKIDVGDKKSLIKQVIRLADPVIRKQMGIQARQKVERRYDWKENIKEMISVYNSLESRA
jgi:glycosyltransferase involved in cell wall biosynthesis